MRLIIGMSGASGAVLGYEALKALREIPKMETHLIVTEGAAQTLRYETNLEMKDLTALADVVHENGNLAAAIASGSFPTDGMIVIPCSMKTLAGIVSGYAENLLLRAADVCLKEGRRLVLVPRETPLSPLHLRNIKEAADLGCRIVPPMMTFYNGADTVEKMTQCIIGKVLAQFGLPYAPYAPWPGRE
ncbi:MAG: UbiX family flavin prenyltransferase [Schwartzia sp.]|nr:UbiX family flavin prenyltransferase [Schwartzia sp. (in: firmicutes)]